MTSPDDAQREAAEESKRKFREALERKKQQNTQPQGAGKRGTGGQIGHAQGPAGHQREFRRKSG